MRVVLHYGVVRAVFADGVESDWYLRYFLSLVSPKELQFVKVIDVEAEKYPQAYNLVLQDIKNDEVYTLVDISEYLPSTNKQEEKQEETSSRKRRKSQEE